MSKNFLSLAIYRKGNYSLYPKKCFGIIHLSRSFGRQSDTPGIEPGILTIVSLFQKNVFASGE